MRSIIGVLLLSFSLRLIFMEFWLLEEAEKASAGRTGLRPDWWQHVGMFLVALVVGWAGLRVLRGSMLGRVVRGRGFRPAPAHEAEYE